MPRRLSARYCFGKISSWAQCRTDDRVLIESRLHHCLDVTMQEDLSRVRNPNAARVLGTIRRVSFPSPTPRWISCARSNKKPKPIQRLTGSVFSRRVMADTVFIHCSFAKSQLSGVSEIEKTRPIAKED
jgi:hypothetical protein